MKVLFLVVALFAIGSFGTGNSPVYYKDLPTTFSVAVNGVIPAAATDSDYLDLYRIWVPVNASSVTMVLNNTSPDCDYIEVYMKTDTAVCPTGYNSDFASNVQGICDVLRYDNDNAASGTPMTITWANYYYDLTNDDGEVYFQTGAYWYIGIAKYVDYDYACSYSILSITTATCPAGQVAIGLDSIDDTPSCAASYPVTLPFKGTITATSANRYIYSAVLNSTYYGKIDVWINSTSEDLEIYTRTGAAPSHDYPNYQYYFFDPDDVGDFFIYSFSVYTPIGSGTWYLEIVNTGGAGTMYDATVVLTPLVCGAGLGGYNCTYPVHAFNPLNPPTTMYTLNPNTPDLYYPFIYFYTDVYANSSAFTFGITVASGTSSAEIYVKWNGYPETEEPYGYLDGNYYQVVDNSEIGYFVVTPNDVIQGGRIYFGVTIDGDTTVNFYVNSTVVTIATTTGSATTGSAVTTTANPATTKATTTANPATTKASTTANPATTKASTTGVSAASALSISSFMVLAALVAALF